MTVRTAYPYRTLRLWTSGDQPVLDVWLGYTPVDAEQKSNRTFIVLCVRRPKIPGLLELAWPVPAWFPNRVFRRGLRNRGDGAIGVQPSGARSESGGISSDPRSQETVGGIGAAARSTFRPWALSGTFQTGTGPRCADPTNRYARAFKEWLPFRWGAAPSKPLSLCFGRALVSARGNRR
jgi:hypothetical protein